MPPEAGFLERTFGAAPRYSETQRQLFSAILSGIPIVGAPAAGAYNLGRIIHALYKQFGNRGGTGGSTGGYASTGTFVPGDVGGSAPTGPGSFAGDPTDPNNMDAYKLLWPGTAEQYADAMRRGGGTGGGTGSLNAGRPAFGQTVQQFNNPGSAIGPSGGGVNTNQTPTPLRIDSHPQGIPGWAAAAMDEARRRNQI